MKIVQIIRTILQKKDNNQNIHQIYVQQHLIENKQIEQLQELIQKFIPLKNFLTKLNEKLYDIQEIQINSIDYFGQRIGFLKCIVSATNKINGKRIPGIVQLRGDAVAVLIEVLNINTNEIKYILTKQIRMPIGQELIEIPAGMLDGNGDITGVAIKEIQEETGIQITKDKLKYLGQAYTSPGLLDELITYFYLKVEFTQQEIQQMQDEIYGEENSNETIKLVFYSFEQCKQLTDGKFFTAIGMKQI